MDNSELEQFQNFIDDLILRNKSIMDQMTKLQDASSRLGRNISKAATTCGCITVTASKQPYPTIITQEICLEDLKCLMHTQVEGFLCPTCQEQIEKEMGRNLFYLGALANTLGISLSSVLENEKSRTNMLGKYCLK